MTYVYWMVLDVDFLLNEDREVALKRILDTLGEGSLTKIAGGWSETDPHSGVFRVKFKAVDLRVGPMIAEELRRRASNVRRIYIGQPQLVERL
jgi:hypothetical protein